MHVFGLLTVALASWPAAAPAFTFDDIEFWAGEGENRAALVIDWIENDTSLPALAWGYRWDGSASGRDMLMAVAAADPRLFIKLGNSATNPVRLYGLGYDLDGDGEFGACNLIECTEFDELGFAYSGEIFVAATVTDDGDLYREGWATGTGFWHYSIPDSPGTNPYDGGNWSDIQVGMASRTLSDGDWDSWAFQLSTTPPFTSHAENPTAAAALPAPLPGDYDGDGAVTAADYGVWKSKFGTADAAADGNRNGTVDAADYTIWRDRFGDVGSSSSTPRPLSVPEPTTLAGVAFIKFLLSLIPSSRRKDKTS